MKITLEMLAQIQAPVLVVAGDLDTVSGEVAPLVAAIAGARGLTLHNRNHMNAVGDRHFKQEAVAFFKSHLLR